MWPPPALTEVTLLTFKRRHPRHDLTACVADFIAWFCRLYVAHLGGAANVVAFDVAPDGSVGAPQPFIASGSDGMAVDCAGNLYLTSNGVQIYSPEGELIGSIAAQGAANVAFGGAERRTLFITATTRLLAVELAIPGLPY